MGGEQNARLCRRVETAGYVRQFDSVDLAALKDDGVGAAALQLILQPADDGGVAS